MSISLKKMLASHEYFKSLKEINFSENIFVDGITSSSKEVKKGFIFVALEGATANSLNGHDFIDEAIKNGASILVIKKGYEYKNNTTMPVLVASDTAKALSFLAESFYDWPSKKMCLIGITGTNGKTSTSFLLYQILKYAGKKVKVMGTLGMGDIENLVPLTHTTMPSTFISKTLNDFKNDEVDVVIMEVSSHALSLGRVEALDFNIAALSNITQEHLDFHGDMNAYIESKKRLFTDLCGEKAKKILPHDVLGGISEIKNVIFYGENTDSYEIVDEILFDGLHTNFTLRIHEKKLDIVLPLAGKFQAKNALLAAGIADTLGVDYEKIKMGLNNAISVKGRLELVKEARVKNLMVMIDFAHTPDALENLFLSIQSLNASKIILVFGCGGDRDKFKRPIMGNIADKYADIIVVTDDNPRTEAPLDIRTQVMSGIHSKKVFEIPDRFLAIKTALSLAGKEDIILIAGKGHENYQIYGEQKKYFNDYESVVEIIESL